MCELHGYIKLRVKYISMHISTQVSRSTVNNFRVGNDGAPNTNPLVPKEKLSYLIHHRNFK
jgi:hypothetical protein